MPKEKTSDANVVLGDTGQLKKFTFPPETPSEAQDWLQFRRVRRSGAA